MERKLRNLPTTAVYNRSPWAGSSWPVHLDGINFEWSEGQPSAAEKYAKAFGLDVTTFMDSVSAQNGINSQPCLPKCTSATTLTRTSFALSVAMRRRATASRRGTAFPCVGPGCHPGAGAKVCRQVQQRTFQTKDIKGLLTDVYYGAKVSTVFAGSRYNGYNDSVDAHGSHTDYSYRDLNPGFFHIAVANLLGLLNTTFIIDRDAGYEVWNQPVVGFKVYEQTAMSPQKAANAFYGLETYPWNEKATSIVYVKSRLSWINETEADGGLIASGLNEKFTVGAYYDYLLELNDVEEIVGGEWLYESNANHPDFLWFLQGKPAADTCHQDWSELRACGNAAG